ncbi:hypothetical protein QBC42DRAFT_273894 [Cladorrhinum samala]|uniref:NACHT domain-containing protein n=1 Tax=Cladorrhinum samala TaxID=585594 RepID=A0AAV9HGA6_9PEZI|nr:hypothetical protein QBC42DRAFT_273894 [Cladorrhinum samala]
MAEAAGAVAALSLAANIIQVTDFGFKFVRKAYNIRESGREGAGELVHLEKLAEDIRAVVNRLDVDEQSPATGIQDAITSHKAISQIAGECKTAVEEILNSIDSMSLSRSGLGRKRDAARAAFKLVWNADKIQTLQGRLNDLKSQLTLNLVESLRQYAMQSLEVQNQIMRRLDNPTGDRGERCAIERKGFGSTVIEYLAHRSDHVSETNPLGEGSLRGDLLGVLYSQEEQTVQDDWNEGFKITPERNSRLQKRLLASLAFDGMATRVDQVDKAHESTFRWVFEDEPNHQKPWHNLKQWLRSDHQVYWITGKAGSGKSTLMKFISQPTELDHDPRCMPYLREWSGSKPLAFASFYFWAAGTELQTSQEGLFRTLLYQILEQNPVLISELFPKRWAALCLFDQDTKYFTDEELRLCLSALVERLSPTTNLCFFIDGLDEFDGDHANLIGLLKGMIDRSSIKLCVASRPWVVFEESLKNEPSLRLEDLTFNDIKHYATCRLQNNADFALHQRQNPEFINSLVGNVVHKASGVFLWVKLVVSSLLDGLKCGDRVSDLQKRLDSLPRDLEDLFERILDQIDPTYFEHASQYFSLMSACREPPSAVLFSLADEDDPRFAFDLSFDPAQWTDSAVKDKTEILQKRLNSRCKGLIEMARESQAGGDGEAIRILPSPTVQYLHKTVKDYIEKPEVQKKLSGRTGNRPFDPHIRLCSASVALLKIFDGYRNAQGIGIEDYISQRKIEFPVFLEALYHAKNIQSESVTKMVQIIDHLGDMFPGWRMAHALNFNETTKISHLLRSGDLRGSESRFPDASELLYELGCRRLGFSFLSFVVRCNLVEYAKARTPKGGMVRDLRHSRQAQIQSSAVPTTSFLPWWKLRPSRSRGRTGASSKDEEWPLLLDTLMASGGPDAGIVFALLENGADPNAVIPVLRLFRGLSCWELSLLKIIHCFSSSAGESSLALQRTTWTEVARLMLAHGASKKKRVIDSAFKFITEYKAKGSLSEKEAAKLLRKEICRQDLQNLQFDFLSELKIWSVVDSREAIL